jgi:hypothetical protein
LTPETATNAAGTQHCVTGTLKDVYDNPVPSTAIVFSVTGANPHATSSAATDSSGQAQYCYTGQTVGGDTIQAYVDVNSNSAQDPSEPADTASKTYIAADPASLALSPQTATNNVGTQHCVTATVGDAYANPASGISVVFTVAGVNTRGPSSVTSDSSGQAQYCYTGQSAGDDTITAYADSNGNDAMDPGEPSDTASKSWAAGRIVAVLDARPDAEQDFFFTAGGGLTPTDFQLDDDADPTLPNTQTFDNVAPGSGYSISETLPSAWELADATCDDGSPVSNIDVSSGETVTCTFVNRTLGYARPRGASPVNIRLVPAFEECRDATGAHGPPLASPSCSPPTQSSSFLTFDAPDRDVPYKGKPDGSGVVTMKVFCSDDSAPPCAEPGDQQDILIDTSVSDVRCVAATSGCSAPGGTYDGELLGRVTLRITDRLNGPSGTSAGTVSDYPLEWGLVCSSGTCSSTTSANAIVPGLAQEQKRAIWQLSQVELLDGGPDGGLAPAPSPESAGCPPACEGNGGETVFLQQGFFAP